MDKPICQACHQAAIQLWRVPNLELERDELICFDCMLERERKFRARLAADPARVDPVAAAAAGQPADREQPPITITRAPRMSARRYVASDETGECAQVVPVVRHRRKNRRWAVEWTNGRAPEYFGLLSDAKSFVERLRHSHTIIWEVK
jgi:hypothetical protein